MSATVLVDTMFYAAIAPLLPTYEADLGLSKTSAGVLSATYPAGTLLASLPAGWLASRVGGKRTMVTGLALLCGSSVAFAFADHIVLLDAARFVQGIGGACSWAGGLSWLMAAAPRDRRGELIGAALGAAVFGVLLGPVLGTAASETSPEAVFSGVSVVAAAAARGRGPRAPRSPAGRPHPGSTCERPSAAGRCRWRSGCSRSPPCSRARSACSCRCGWTTSAPARSRSAPSSWWGPGSRRC